MDTHSTKCIDLLQNLLDKLQRIVDVCGLASIQFTLRLAGKNWLYVWG
jgi:hypothetical protein